MSAVGGIVLGAVSVAVSAIIHLHLWLQGYKHIQFVDRVGPSWGIVPDLVTEPRRRFLPLSALPRTYASRLLVVGDAAGLVKPTTGGGIYYSLVSAALAAETLISALRSDRLDADALSVYQQRWRHRLGPEFQAQLALRMLAQRMSDAEIDSLFDLALTDGVMPIVRSTARFNRHRELIWALFRHPPARLPCCFRSISHSSACRNPIRR